MSEMQRQDSMASDTRPDHLRDLPISSVHNSGDYISRGSQAIEIVVSCDVVCYQPEERSKCHGVAESAWSWQLCDRMDMVAQTPSSNGPAGAGQA